MAVANQSETIKNLISDMEDNVDEFVVPLLNVSGLVLAKVIQYWKQHAEVNDKEQLDAFDRLFVDMQKELLFDALIAVNFLESRPLLILLCKAIADNVKDMPVEEVREYFSIENDFTEEEEQTVRAENQWAF
ncbi:SKP1-like protein [Musa troglodytarum]|nr:SKP1-like protein [Musa troglodytarum]